MKVDPPVRLEDISNCHRVGATEKSDRPILVKFMNYQISSRVFKAKKKLKDFNKRANQDPEAADDPDEDPSNSNATPDVPGNLPLFPNKIYINEDLCKGRAYLSFKARQIKNADGIADTWTFNGNIMVKDKKNKIHKVTCMYVWFAKIWAKTSNSGQTILIWIKCNLKDFQSGFRRIP